MPSIVKRGNRYRALVRKGGHVKCATFGTRAAAKAWASTVEQEIDELRASGVMQPRGQTVAGLIDRYTEEIYPLKPWGRTKTADLARLKKDLGHHSVATLTSHLVTEYFRKRQRAGSGGVVVSSQLGYLLGVLKTARSLWHLDVPLQAALDAREGLSRVRLISKSNQRDRRVTDAEIRTLITHFRKKPRGGIPFPDIIQFSVATTMRISEVCRLRWSDLNESNKTIVIRDRKHPKDKIGNDSVVPLLNATGYDAFDIIKRQWKDEGQRIFPYNSRTISSLISRAIDATRLKNLRLHDLRHEGTSRLFDAGYQIQQVALVTGHRDWKSLKRYTHVRAADLHRKVNGATEDRK